MAAPVKPLAPLKQAAGPSPLTPEQKYWKSFKAAKDAVAPSNYPITHISVPTTHRSIGNSSPGHLAITTGYSVQIYSIRTKKFEKPIPRFDDVAHGAEIRQDGRILVAGDETGAIKVFEVGSKAIIKTWRVHKQPVWTTKFSPSEPTTLMSASDDCTVRLWDLPSQDSTRTFTGHTDYVRSGAFMPGQPAGVVVSGSYDQTVRLWDSRASQSAVLAFKHAEPVEAVLPMPSGTSVLAATGNKIIILDITAGKPLHTIQNHQKTVTAISIASQGSRLVSGALDGHMKVFETVDWNVVYGVKYSSPILSLGVIPFGNKREDRILAVGMQSGSLSIKTRLSSQEEVREKDRQEEMQAMYDGRLEQHDRKRKRSRKLEKRIRGLDFSGDGADVVIQGSYGGKRKKPKPWEKALRDAHYARALDLSLEGSDPIVVATVLTALRHRSAMRNALFGRDEVTLHPVLRWIHKHIVDPRYVSLCVECGLLIIDIYSSIMGRSREIDILVMKFHEQIRKEVDRAQQAWQTDGMLNLLLGS